MKLNKDEIKNLSLLLKMAAVGKAKFDLEMFERAWEE